MRTSPRFSCAMRNPPHKPMQGDERTGEVESLSSRVTFNSCFAPACRGPGSPIFLAPRLGVYPLTSAEGLAQIKFIPLSWPCGRVVGGGPGTAVSGSTSRGFWGKTHRHPGWAGAAWTLQLCRPRSRWMTPGVRLQTRKSHGKAGRRALRCLPARGRLLPVHPLLAGALRGWICPCPAPHKSHPRSRSTPKVRRLLRFSLPGKERDFAGTALQSDRERCPWPRPPGRVRALGSDLFLVQLSFFPPASWLRGEEGAGVTRETTSRDVLSRGISPQSRSVPRPLNTPSPVEPGAGGCPDRGGCFPRGATTNSARRRQGQGTLAGTFYQQLYKRRLGQGPRSPPRLSLLWAPWWVPPGSLRLSALAASNLWSA